MGIHILIPEANSYGIAIAVIFCLGNTYLAEKIHRHWLRARGINFAVVHRLLLSLIVVWGFLIIDVGSIFGNSVGAELASFPLGLVAGGIAGWSDRAIVRYLVRRQLIVAKHAGRSGPTLMRQTRRETSVLVRSGHLPGSDLLSKRPSIRSLTNRKNMRYALASQGFSRVSSLVLAAVLEELTYRGLLLKACLLLPTNSLIVIAIVGGTMAFALSHISFGWPHVLAKLPLSALAMITVLILGTVLPAIIAHMVFNIGLWKATRNQPVFAGSPRDRAASLDE